MNLKSDCWFECACGVVCVRVRVNVFPLRPTILRFIFVLTDILQYYSRCSHTIDSHQFGAKFSADPMKVDFGLFSCE